MHSTITSDYIIKYMVLNTINKHASKKKKTSRLNHAPYIRLSYTTLKFRNRCSWLETMAQNFNAFLFYSLKI